MTHEDETKIKPEWANRPRIGDTIALEGLPDFVGVVKATFYGNGEGGLHVQFDCPSYKGVSWASCHRVVIVKRAEP